MLNVTEGSIIATYLLNFAVNSSATEDTIVQAFNDNACVSKSDWQYIFCVFGKRNNTAFIA